ncbi:hypothetical protein LTS18_006352 [Coniosporium uncinatum]|uniref:Uncharacterized protein n=1 Tax=Coniosporium uncinatum TaxID=93489 RepID=A0ACC3DB38_9PEZI|nr:hypothetical protein LTS18_006352 [Coniosporium uncinatum]
MALDTAAALVLLTIVLILLGGNGTKLSVCVAFGPPLVVRFAVNGTVPSAKLKWLIVRLKKANDARG